MQKKTQGTVVKSRRQVLNKGYSYGGANTTKNVFKGYKATSGSPYEDIDKNNYTLRQRSRELYMTAPLATSAIDTNVVHAIGDGLRLCSVVDADILGWSEEQANAWQNKTNKEFKLWAEDKQMCDYKGINDFYDMQNIAATAWLASGDVLAIKKWTQPTAMKPYGLKIDLVEADLCASPNSTFGSKIKAPIGINKNNGNEIYDGVEVDENGRIVAYHFCNKYPFSYDTFSKKLEWNRVPAYGETGLPLVYHVLKGERPSQYRGVPFLAKIIEPLLQIKRYTESELETAVIESFFTAFIETDSPEVAFTDTMGISDGDSEDDEEISLGPGMMHKLKTGEKVNFVDPKRPNSGFAPFLTAMCTQLGAAIGEPAEVLEKRFNSSYSAARAALIEAWVTFKLYRIWFVADFNNPIYEAWLTEAVAIGRISAPGFFTDPIIRKAYLGAKWIGSSAGQLDPLKEVNAQKIAVESGFTTREQATAELNGGSYLDNVHTLSHENPLIVHANVGLTTSNVITVESEDEDAEHDNKENR